MRYFNYYLKILPNLFFGSGLAFIVDLITYSILRSHFGINISAILAFIFGVNTLYFTLRIRLKSKIKRKRKGLLIQLLIGVGSLLINIFILNMIDLFLIEFYPDDYFMNFNQSSIYAGITKTISSSIGFIWTSTMTSRFVFESSNR